MIDTEPVTNKYADRQEALNKLRNRLDLKNFCILHPQLLAISER